MSDGNTSWLGSLFRFVLVALAIATHTPKHPVLHTLNEKLKFAQDLGTLKHLKELYMLKQVRNDFLHNCHAGANMTCDVVLNILEAELTHWGFGPLERVYGLYGNRHHGAPDIPTEMTYHVPGLQDGKA